MDEPIVTAHLNLGAISDKRTRDTLRRAVAEAAHGPVWIERQDGTRIGAIVTAGDAERLAHLLER